MSDKNVPKNHEILSRSPGVGMEPKSILIGDRLRHTVHNGALKLPCRALTLIEEWSVPPVDESDHVIILPSVGSIARPTLDQTPISVTVLQQEKVFLPVSSTSDGELASVSSPVETIRTVAVNQTWNPLLHNADRIRGGGEIDDEDRPDAKAVIANDVPKSVSQVFESDKGIRADSEDAEEKSAEAAITTTSPHPIVTLTAAETASVSQEVLPTLQALSNKLPFPSDPGIVALAKSENKAQHIPNSANFSVSEAAAPMTTQPTSFTSTENSTAPTPPANQISKAQPHVTQSGVAAPQMARPPVVSSSAQSLPKKSPVLALPKVPPPQYAQHIPGPNDEMQAEIQNARAPWYKNDGISELERTLLPEWFDSSALHRTPNTYIKAREHILKMSTQLGNRFITNTLIRRTIPGDAGSLSRLFNFLLSYGFINADAINDSTPTASSLRETNKRSLSTKFEDSLANVILKKHKTGSIDWQEVADEIGVAVSAEDCRKGFLSLDLSNIHLASVAERSITPDPSDKSLTIPDQQDKSCLSLHSILSTIDDKVLIPTIDTALKHTEDLVCARNATIRALIASQATLKAKAEEDNLVHVLSELTEMRMLRLEKRIELLNDVEGMLEAERMALELERRDLYTTRCRHWFGGNS